jgi:hypothetical protein
MARAASARGSRRGAAAVIVLVIVRLYGMDTPQTKLR